MEVISNTSEGLWGEEKRIRLEEEWIIGTEDGDDSEMFGYIRGVAGADGKGRLYFIENEPYPRIIRCRLIAE